MDSTQTAAPGVGLRPTLVATVVEDGAVLLDLDSKYFYRLNGPAWAIVQLVENAGATADAIVERCRAFGASQADEAAIRAFVARCSSEGLFEPLPAEEPAEVVFSGAWSEPVMDRQAEPLQGLVTSAFDPSVPLAE